MEGTSVKRSNSRPAPSSRPTTPLRPGSRTSLRESHGHGSTDGSSSFPLQILEPAFAELSDSMADLEANFMHLQLMHESLSRFSESFASFLYGLNMNAFCVDFPEAPVPDSFGRARGREEFASNMQPFTTENRPEIDAEATFLTTDTSFVDNPPVISRSSSKSATLAPPERQTSGLTRSGSIAGRGSIVRGLGRGGRASGLARVKGRV
ncbi:DASH complex subunit dam1 [Xylographa parallela]|nr:DASH complex subunit dam1 [Xylographa parallela]